MKIFIAPSAGSIGHEYKVWNSHGSNHEFIQLKYSGRGERFDSLCYDSWNTCTQDIYRQITDKINEHENYGLLGHSMGSMVIYDIFQKISESNRKKPSLIIFSGCNTPVNADYSGILELSKSEFKDYFVSLGGISNELLEHGDFIEYIIDNIMNDIKILNQFTYTSKPEFGDTSVIVLNGTEDRIKDRKEEWQKFIGPQLKSYKEFSGGHFFLYNEPQRVIDFIDAAAS